MALALVQEQIRYLFLGMDDGGYVPAAADLTWSRRFGDCKGKTALLLALLRELKVEAEPALVNLGGGDGMNERLPSVAAFNHVIVRATIDGQVYWLDGTRTGDRAGIDELRPPPHRWALPVRARGAELEEIKVPPLDEPARLAGARARLEAVESEKAAADARANELAQQLASLTERSHTLEVELTQRAHDLAEAEAQAAALDAERAEIDASIVRLRRERVPSPSLFVVKNGSKIRGSVSASIPVPVSLTLSAT